MAQPDPCVYDVELRCSGTIHGIMRGGLLEVKCRSIKCSRGRPVNVFHYFDPDTGELVETKVYKNPDRRLTCRHK